MNKKRQDPGFRGRIVRLLPGELHGIVHQRGPARHRPGTRHEPCPAPVRRLGLCDDECRPAGPFRTTGGHLRPKAAVPYRHGHCSSPPTWSAPSRRTAGSSSPDVPREASPPPCSSATRSPFLSSVFDRSERGRILGMNVSVVYMGLTVGPFHRGIHDELVGVAERFCQRDPACRDRLRTLLVEACRAIFDRKPSGPSTFQGPFIMSPCSSS